jgi:Putative gypsy type transposon
MEAPAPDLSQASQAPAPDLSQASRACWKGSKASAVAVEALIRARKMPAEIEWRIPGDEIVPQARPGERIVFLAHFARGFGLPASTFFRSFLDFHHLQPHHIAANFIMILSGFVTLCEGYLGCRPSIALWKRFFNLRAHNARTGITGPPTVAGGKPTNILDMTDTGCCLVAAGKSKYQGPDIVQSCKDWQRTFFYVKSPDNGPDLLNLPEFSVTRPAEKYQWGLRYGVGDVDVDNQVKRVARLERDGLLPNDLAAAWLHARILPLQRRVHRLCDLSGPRDPTRISTCRIKMEDLCRRLRDITNSHLPEPYRFGLMYLTRQEKPRMVCTDCIPDFLLTRLLF